MTLATEQIFLAIIFILAIILAIIFIVLMNPTIRMMILGLPKTICEKIIPSFILNALRFLHLAPC
ncbi:MAG: hypothetical protein QXQ18_00160 [Candidatus Aenigmatarchaeota archaeon]